MVRCLWDKAKRKWADARSRATRGTAGVFASSLDGEAEHNFLHCGSCLDFVFLVALPF